jgi:hypothetical protein
MWITSLRRLAFALFLIGLAGAAQAQNSPAAQHVIDRARAASGGTRAWNALRGLHEVGHEGGQRYERWVDPVRYGARTDTQTPAGKHVQAYNGAAEWRILPNGVITGSQVRADVARVRSNAFFDAYGYYFPSRFDLRSTHLGVRQHQGKSYDVLRIQPAGGAPRELWFDRRTGLLAQIIDDTDGKRLTTEFSDYRRAGGVLMPFKAVTYGGDLSEPRERTVEKMDFPVANRSLFSLPPPKAEK